MSLSKDDPYVVAYREAPFLPTGAIRWRKLKESDPYEFCVIMGGVTVILEQAEVKRDPFDGRALEWRWAPVNLVNEDGG